MPQKLALIALLLAALACSLPLDSAPTASPVSPTPDLLATLVSENLTAAAQSATPTAPPAAQTPTPEPPASNLLVVYARQGKIMLWREGNTPQPLTTTGQDNQPRISDDGQWIAFLRGGELYAVRADGTGERPLVTRAYMDGFRATDVLEVRVSQFDFLPASHDIFFELLGDTEAYPMPVNDLQKVNAASGGPAVVLAPGQGGGRWFISPDNQWLALAQSAQVRVMRLDGSQDRVVFKFKLVSTYSEWFYYPQLAWRDDSAGFYTVIPASAALENPTEPARYYYIPLAGEPAKLAEFAAVPVWVSFPFIAPNGVRVAYVTENAGSQTLRVIDASTAGQVYASAPNLSILNWNPDSLRVAYTGGEPPAASLAAPGSPAIPLNDTPKFSEMRWVSAEHFLYLNGEELRLRTLPGPSTLIDSEVGGYDFVLLP